ncbi:MAG: hypothetical protein NWE98_01340 [Candidatus Bathyarchaeota archaeon]|nr:hypothetical protein [Candidatus Bathyarchaeota archaeon]
MSLKPKAKSRNEAKYYEPIKNSLLLAMGNYLDKEKTYQPQAGLSRDTPELIYFEIIGGRNVFSENLKKVFDDDALNIIGKEGIYPDLVGYVQKNPHSPKEIIIAEIKDEKNLLKDGCQNQIL